MRRLPDKLRKKLIADYAECHNYSEVGRRNGVSYYVVKSVVKEDPKITEIIKQKSEKNCEDILDYMSRKSKGTMRFFDYVMDERLNPEKNRTELDKIPLPQIVTAFGIVIDKALKAKEIILKQDIGQDIEGINNSINSLASLLNKPVKNRAIESSADTEQRDENDEHSSSVH